MMYVVTQRVCRSSSRPQIDKYLYSSDPYVVAGALLAIGVVNCCVQVSAARVLCDRARLMVANSADGDLMAV